MGAIYSYWAMPKICCTYDKTLPYLKFVSRSDGHFVPILHYVLDINLPTLLMLSDNSACMNDINVEYLANQYECNIFIFKFIFTNKK